MYGEAGDPNDRGFNVNRLEEERWNLDRAREWSNFARADEDSAEFVIGVSDAHPDAYAKLRRIISVNGGKVVDKISSRDKTWAIVVDIPFDLIPSIVHKVKATGLAEYVEPNMKFQTQFVPNDPYWSLQWGPQKLEADWAWNTTVGDNSVLVAVLDTGIDYNHPDLNPNYIPWGYDWVNNDSDPMDDHGHGTHVAGIIAAALNNGIGIAGLAQVGVMAEKVLDNLGAGFDSWIANGIIDATDKGAKIISMSFGGYFSSETLHNAVKYASAHGVLLIAAAGNNAANAPLYPAYYEEVIAVAATDQDDSPADFTNFGPWIELSAPGVSIYSTFSGNTYRYASGTSMATPHVAGTAALILSRFPQFTRDQARIHLRRVADDLGAPGFDIHYGFGRVNAKTAVEQNPPDHDLLVLNWERPPYMRPGTVTINATVLNYGLSDENNVIVQLWVNDSLLISSLIENLPSGASSTVEFSLAALSTGVYNFTVFVVPVLGETNIDDNSVCGYVGTEQGIIKVPAYYPTIQEAVDAASSGDTILVSSGTYNEAVYLNKNNITLKGESRETTIINGTRNVRTIYAFYADNLYIRQFTIQNGKDGIYLGLSSNIGIYGNIITANRRLGINLYDSSNISIIGNTISANGDDGIMSQFWSMNITIYANNITANAWYGIGLVNANSTNICGNNITANRYNAILLRGPNSRIHENNVANNGLGIEFYGSNITVYRNNVIESGVGIWTSALNSCICENTLTNNRADGIQIEDSDNIAVYRNSITGNGRDGIAVWWSLNINITGNDITSNSVGIEYVGSSNSIIYRNNIIGNMWEGLLLRRESSNNTIHHNNFINNTVQVDVVESTSFWDNGYPFGGNYWSDYTGADVKKGPNQDEHGSDGIGDTPYVIDENNRDRYPLMSPYGSPPPPTYTLTITATVGGTTDPAPGTYSYTANSSVQITAIPNVNYLFDHWELNGGNIGSNNLVNVTMNKDYTLHAVFMYGTFDVAVTDVVLYKSVVAQGYSMRINVTVANQGSFTETFNVTVYANETPAQTKVVTLASGNFTSITFTWNTTGFAKGNYTISAVADKIPDETDTSDNTYVSRVPVHVGVPGDVSSAVPGVPDYRVDARDITYLILLFDTRPGSQNWNPNADINDDSVVNARDITIAVINFYEHE
ncbi:MAG: S8 family serine peptidase [Candidatus Bathyarchaeia archaeon]